MLTLYKRILRLPHITRNVIVGTLMLGFGAVVMTILPVLGVSESLAYWARIPLTWPAHYTLHRKITWKERRHDAIGWQSLRYVGPKLVTMFVGWKLYELIHDRGLHYMLAYVVSYLAIGSVQFIVNNKYVFFNAVQQTVK